MPNKPITKKRLLSALDRISEVCHKREKYADVFRQAAKNGMRQVLGGSVSQVESDKLGLEIAISEMPLPKCESDIERLIDQKKAHWEHYWKWRDYVFAIQAKHKISGVELHRVKVLGAEIEQPNICTLDGLPYIEEDMSILREYRPKIVSQFIELLKVNGFTECKKVLTIECPGSIYHDHAESVVPIEEILVAASLYDWASVWTGYGNDTPCIDFCNGLDGTSSIVGRVSFEAILPCS